MILGTIGSKQSRVEFEGKSFKLSIKNKTIMNSLSIVCFQRTGLQLKTIDVAWISQETIQIQTISSKDYQTTCTLIKNIPMYDLGPQVGSWKKWQKKASKEQWLVEDWKIFLSEMEPEVCELDTESSDSDWQPPEPESESDSESE